MELLASPPPLTQPVTVQAELMTGLMCVIAYRGPERTVSRGKRLAGEQQPERLV